MKIAYITENRTDTILPFSGIPFFMAKALQEEVTQIYQIKVPMFDLELMFSNPESGSYQLETIGRYATEKLKTVNADCILCQGSSMIPFIETDSLICLWHDSTWQALMQIPFDEFRNNYPLLYEWDKSVITKSSLIIYAAEWLKNETVKHYPSIAKKIKVIPFGASLFDVDEESIKYIISSRMSSPCQLTFIGVDWVRKGLPLVYSLMNRLNSLGIPTILNIVGCDLKGAGAEEDALSWESSVNHFSSGGLLKLRLLNDPNVINWGFLNKDSSTDYKKFCDILKQTHFLVHPADFECFGVVLAEANAFGVPIISINRYGPKSIVKSGINGELFKFDSFIQKASEYIVNRLENYEIYLNDCKTSFIEFKRNLNWAVNCKKVVGFMADFL